jgi:hypothetical protein
LRGVPRAKPAGDEALDRASPEAHPHAVCDYPPQIQRLNRQESGISPSLPANFAKPEKSRCFLCTQKSVSVFRCINGYAFKAGPLIERAGNENSDIHKLFGLGRIPERSPPWLFRARPQQVLFFGRSCPRSRCPRMQREGIIETRLSPFGFPLEV